MLHRIGATRRDLLLGAGAGLLLPGMAWAKGPFGQSPPQAPYYYRFMLGKAECTIVSDGQLPLGDPNASFKNISTDEIKRQLQDNFLPTQDAVLEQNILVMNTGDRVVLFDTGMGQDQLFGPSTGQLQATIHQAGIDPASVDAVVMSHAHIDHCGGLIGADGKPNFPNAEYYLAESDFKYWTDDSVIPADYPARPHFLAQARNNLLPLQEKIHFFRDHEEFLPGITALSAPGHTVGHTIFMINNDGKQLCYVGDLAHHPVLLLERPLTQFAFDTDPAQSAQSRVRMLTMLAANRVPLLAYHFAWPGIGHVSKAGDGFHYHPEPAQMQSVTGL
jgi:glyoxylase-like metal-dependent hydrolase (beta-lactamase superfamily II)